MNEVIVKDDYNVDAAKAQLNQIKSFIRSMMKKDVDYGVIPGCKKPSLFKSGAEKLAALGKLKTSMQLENKIEDFAQQFVFYRYKCVVLDREGTQVGEAIGSANNKEKKWASQDVYSMVNTIDKMAQKRAYVSAIISVMRVSSDFTCDVEDMELKPDQPVKNVVDVTEHVCVACGKMNLMDKVAKFSAERYGKVLCYNCQKKEYVGGSDGSPNN